jgi:hypothetical protein
MRQNAFDVFDCFYRSSCSMDNAKSPLFRAVHPRHAWILGDRGRPKAKDKFLCVSHWVDYKHALQHYGMRCLFFNVASSTAMDFNTNMSWCGDWFVGAASFSEERMLTNGTLNKPSIPLGGLAY